ncbi:2-polyprenyl-6-methoxyphenol hydroxylase [Fusarium heterosporum]|uniref:2-polyprenyl-6-methoxyphenol hydroxylase n=1 Tax=Fusarium heterosporum TaxID=42747 RepID=A0A8H5WDE0_FUSHE|nr:2-polyprenyl-6-methoxyphenol hydroxylase [Fusarium heterosporum]
MAPLKVLIVGAGVAGPSLAHWLSRLPCEVTLIERSPQVRATGQQVDIRAQGVPVMRKMGIEAAVRAKFVREAGTQLIDTNGKTKAFFPITEHGSEHQSITTEFEIKRGDLVRILMGLTEKSKNVQHRFGTTITSLTQDEESDPNGKVHIGFNDGGKDDFDLVVAADGTGSRTRQMMLGPEAPDPRYFLGGYIGFFSVLSKPHDSDRFTFCHLPGSKWIGTRKDCPEMTRVYMQLRGQNEALIAAHKSGDLAELKTAWASAFNGGQWECNRFMDALKNSPEADDLYSTPSEEVRLPKGSWSKGRVVAIGDAAHAHTASGFGSTWGMVGSYILAGEIATLLQQDPTTAVVQGVKKYEDVLRPVATAQQGDLGEHREAMMIPKTAFGIWVLHSMARAAAYFKWEQGMGMASETAKWQVPEYPALDDQK